MTPLAFEHRLQVRHVPIAALLPADRQPRTHPPRQIRKLMRSMMRVGFTNPVIVDEHARILAGHGRVEAARRLGMAEVPTVCLAGLGEAEKRAYALADNRVALDAGWDAELVRLELAYIAELDLEFDLTLTGFETTEIDLALDGPVPRDDPADRLDVLVGPQSAGWETFGNWIGIDCTLAIPSIPPATRGCSVAGSPSWCSPTHPTTCRSTAMPAALEESAMPTSPWPAARCRPRPSSPSCARRWRCTWRTAATVPCTMSAWTGGTWPSSTPPAPGSTAS